MPHKNDIFPVVAPQEFTKPDSLLADNARTAFIAYQSRMHTRTPKMETGATAALPEYFADMLDWRQKADLLAAAWQSLPQAERAQAVIYTKNYGDASAVNVYRPDHERGPVFICRGPHENLHTLWPRAKFWY